MVCVVCVPNITDNLTLICPRPVLYDLVYIFHLHGSDYPMVAIIKVFSLRNQLWKSEFYHANTRKETLKILANAAL